MRDAEGNFSSIDVPAAESTQAFGINARGEIVGAYWSNARWHGFVRDKDGAFTAIDVPGSVSSNYANGINSRSDILGSYCVTFGGPLRGFLWTKDGFAFFDLLGAESVNPYGINGRGQIVGSYRAIGGGRHGFLYEE